MEKGHVDVYTENDITLYAYQTRNLIDDEVFIVAKAGHGVVIELPCFYDNIRELTLFLASEGVKVTQAAQGNCTDVRERGGDERKGRESVPELQRYELPGYDSGMLLPGKIK